MPSSPADPNVASPADPGAARPAAAADGPLLVAESGAPGGTGLILFPRAGSLPAVWAGPVPAAAAWIPPTRPLC